MNRRTFLNYLFAAASIVVTDPDIDKIINKFSNLDDDEFLKQDFVAYVTIQMNMIVHNPRQSMIITDINNDK